MTTVTSIDKLDPGQRSPVRPRHRQNTAGLKPSTTPCRYPAAGASGKSINYSAF